MYIVQNVLVVFLHIDTDGILTRWHKVSFFYQDTSAGCCFLADPQPMWCFLPALFSNADGECLHIV